MSSTPEVSRVQNLLLDCVIAALTTLRALSPDLVDLMAGDLADHGQYDQLIAISFSSPSFEMEVITN